MATLLGKTRFDQVELVGKDPCVRGHHRSVYDKSLWKSQHKKWGALCLVDFFASALGRAVTEADMANVVREVRFDDVNSFESPFVIRLRPKELARVAGLVPAAWDSYTLG